MVRRVVQHIAKSIDNEKLLVVTIYETGINKEQIKRLNEFSKKHEVLVPSKSGCEWKG